MVGIASLGVAVSALARPQPTLSAALALGAPWRTAFPPALPPLTIRADAGERRGQSAEVAITALGRDRVQLASRPAGGTIERRELTVPDDGALTARTRPIDVPTRFWVEDARGGASDTVLIRALEPLLVQDVRVQIEYPAYLGREPEVYRGQIPPLVTPEGTTLILSGETNIPLDAGRLSWVGPDGVAAAEGPIDLEISDARFGASWIPRGTGRWTWALSASASIGEPILPEAIRVLVVPDLLPRIQLLYPAPDTTLGFEQVMPLVVDIEDDIGLRRAALRTWRSGLGADRREQRDALSPAPGGSRRAVFRHLLDRSGEDLLPGDTIFYQFEAFDGHPRRGPALSDVFTLRVPTFAEISEARAQETEELSDEAQALEDALEALAESAADAARQADAEEGDFEATEEARAVLDEAQRARDELSQLEEDLAALREDLSESALADPALEEQLERLAERYEELSEEGLLEEIDALAEALRDLDPEALREALEALAENSEDLREQLEQTLGMLEQAALEQAMKSAQTNADELADAQRDLAEEAELDTFAEDQAALAEQAEALAEALAELERELAEAGRDMAADSAAAAGQRTEEAMQSMQAAQEGTSGDPAGEPSEGAAERQAAAEQAAEALEQAASALGSAEQNMSGEGGEAAVETLSRARSEALSLADEEGRLADATRGDETADPETWRARQGAVRQGLENLLERLSDAGNEAAMLDQATGAAAGEAAERMDRLLERLAEDGARRLPSRAEAEGVQNALNQLAQQLLANEQAARAGQEQSAGEQAAEQMAQMAQQQQAVTQETSSLLMPGPKPAGEEQIREQLARRQEEIADQLGELEDPEGDLLGSPEEMAEEAAELARELELQGPTQETLERQRRLFRRMLDAGRSLEDEDLDPNRRESETGEAEPREPPPIDPTLLQGRRFPLPPEALLRELPLHYRALIFDYFDRLNRAPVRPPEGERRDP